MTLFTNKGLVEYVNKALSEKWGYVWGTFGQVLTDALFRQKLEQYPEHVGKYKDFIVQNWLGRKVADCVGLIKGYYWTADGRLTYDAGSDVTASGMYEKAAEKGEMATIPEIPGLCVFKQGHIGVYIGDGKVIEAKGTQYGIVQTPLKGAGANRWTHWLKCPYIKYEEVKRLDWKEIVQKAASSPAEWENAINVAVNAAKAEGNLGALEIFKYLPELIEKIYNAK